LDGPAQLALLARLDRRAELADVPNEHGGRMEYFWWNPSFGPGDAEYLYGLLRERRPRRMVEVGAGLSTLMAWRALERNAREGHPCELTCIEPYEHAWLEQLGPRVLREPLERAPRSVFGELGAGDVLFVDSSHVVRPGGDVLLEVLELLPALRPGVAVHFHDVFTPWHYPRAWLVDDLKLWNEQYLLEAFLSCNREFRVLGALHWLARRHAAEFEGAFPVYARRDHPWTAGSFWIERV
ncbi:MAG TPA: class I SAM-dependent methyltransferase, partial [Planctomycetota bacterium]|nr:class I SAM-dependent methyltransferase [Planctomycetota bacterium]